MFIKSLFNSTNLCLSNRICRNVMYWDADQNSHNRNGYNQNSHSVLVNQYYLPGISITPWQCFLELQICLPINHVMYRNILSDFDHSVLIGSNLVRTKVTRCSIVYTVKHLLNSNVWVIILLRYNYDRFAGSRYDLTNTTRPLSLLSGVSPTLYTTY